MTTVTLTYTVTYSDKDAAKVLSVLDEYNITPNGGKHLANGRSSLTFREDVTFEDGVRNGIYREDECNLYNEAADMAGFYANEFKAAGVFAVVDYSNDGIEDVLSDLADEYPWPDGHYESDYEMTRCMFE